MKKLTILWIIILIVYLIYSLVNVNKINYVSISDEVFNNYDDYIKEYLINNNKLGIFNNSFLSPSVIELYNDIKNNRTIRDNNNDYYLKKVLRESDVLVINVGMKELASFFDKYNMKNNSIYFNELYSHIKSLIKEIKKYAYDTIIFIGYYNPTNYYDANIDRLFYDMDIKLNKLMMDNDIVYINLYELVKGNDYKENNSFYLNENGNKKIASSIELNFT